MIYKNLNRLTLIPLISGIVNFSKSTLLVCIILLTVSLSENLIAQERYTYKMATATMRPNKSDPKCTKVPALDMPVYCNGVLCSGGTGGGGDVKAGTYRFTSAYGAKLDACYTGYLVDILISSNGFVPGQLYFYNRNYLSGSVSTNLPYGPTTSIANMADVNISIGISPITPDSISYSGSSGLGFLNEGETIALTTESNEVNFSTVNANYGYEIQYLDGTINRWITIRNPNSFTVPYSILTDHTDDGRNIYFRSRIYRIGGYEPIKYSYYFYANYEVKKKIDVKCLSIDTCYCSENTTNAYFRIGSVEPGDSVLIAIKGGSGGSDITLGSYGSNCDRCLIKLPVGNYALVYEYRGIVKDGSFKLKMSDTVNFDIKAFPKTITLNVETQNTKCYGSNDGEIKITASGGTPNYTFKLESEVYNSASSASFKRDSGKYLITVTDSRTCTANTGIINILQPDPLEIAQLTYNNITCFGRNDGSINITAKGGKRTYKYLLKKGNTLIENNITGIFDTLSVGDYNVTIQNSDESCNSITSNTITLTQPSVLELSGNAKIIDCFGNKGSMTLTATGGNGGYTYKINTNGDQPENMFEGIEPGLYTFGVIDTKGCTATYNYTFTEPAQLFLSIDSVKPVSCFGDSDGNVWLSSKGGIEPYKYRYNGNWGDDSSFSGLRADKYTFWVKDSNNCTAYKENIIINQPSVLKLETKSFNDVICFGGNNGSVELTASGGNSNYKYSSNGTDWLENPIFNTLTASEYQFHVKDRKGCHAENLIAIKQPGSIKVLTSHKNITCNGYNNGSITIKINEGIKPYTIKLNDNETFTTYDSITIINRKPINYSISITDSNKCNYPESINITISEPKEPLSAIVKAEMIKCFGQQNGTISITPNGGTPPYKYSYNGGHDTLPLNNSIYIFKNLEKGIYSITAEDANGCESEQKNIPITEPTKLLASSKKVDLRCFNTNDGSINIKATDGTKPYWISNNYGSSFVKTDSSYTFTALSAKTYGLVVKDSNNCTADIENVTLTQPSFFTLAVENFADVSCNNGNNGWVQLTASGGNPTLLGGKSVYSFTKDNAVWIDSVSPFTINQLQAKDYQFSVKDTQGCEAKVSHTVNQPQPISISKSITNIKCKGESNGKIVFEVLGGKSPYIVKTSFPDKQTDTKSNVNQPIEYSNLKVGNYSLSITDSFGCSSDFDFEIKEPEQTIELAVDSIQMPSCYGDSNGNAFLSSNGGWGKYMYSIDSISKTSTSGAFTGLSKGKYRVTAVDSLGCSTETSIVVNQPDSLILLEPIVTPLSCKDNGTGVIELSALGGTPSYNFGVGGSYTKDNKRQNLAAGNYNVSVRDSKGCTATTRVTVNEPERLIVSLSNTNHSGFSVSCTDSVRVKPMGGIAPYTIHYDDKDSLCSPSGYLIHSKPSGSYPLLISDSNGCTAKATAVVSNLPGPKINGIEVSNASCSYSSDGKISIHTSTLTNSVRVEWENGRVGNSIDNLPGGYYRAIAIDEFGCSSDTLIAVSKPDSLIVNLVELKHPTCFGFADGIISVNATGGNNTSTYKYQWNNNVQDYSTGLVPSGNYTLVVTDNKSCVANAAFSLTDPPSVQPSIPLEVTICSNQTYNAKAGVPGLSFLWFSENGFAANTPNVQLSNAGVYYLLVTDGNGCMGRDTLTLKTDAGIIDADFLMADSASIGDTLAIVETSWPVPQALQWIYPSAFRELKRTEYTIYLIPEIEGVFPIGLFTYVGPCSEYIEKQIKIGKSKPKPVEKTTIEPIIKSALLIPNPNNGRFNLVVDLSRDNGIVVEIFTMYGEKIMRNEYDGLNAYSIETNIKNLPGMYLVKVSAGKENKSLRVVVQ